MVEHLHGKEGVNGSSPLEGFAQNPCKWAFCVASDGEIAALHLDIVEDAGFTAVQAVNADEALSILESRSDISLLFSDIQMPGSMDGLKLAHAVHDRWPSIKIILVIRTSQRTAASSASRWR